ncbi:MAG: phosphoribosylglycinamide formyltransferase [Deltaproteobacteria bacterium]|nr:phosphoribosylglycinamide formyltransferase [Deltaproteobacteria bacterium]
MNRLVVLFSGRGSNLVAIQDAIVSGPLAGLARIEAAICNRVDAGGIERARALGVAVEVLPSKGRARDEYDEALLAKLREYSPDLIVLAGWMLILSPGFVRSFPSRIVNIHPADTRLHQGLHGYEWAMENRLQETLVTVHLVDEGLDTGPMILRAPVDLRGATTIGEVERRGLEVEHEVYAKAIAQLLSSLPKGA